MIEVLFLVARHEIALGRRRRLRSLDDGVLEQHIHEQIHRLGLDDQGPRWFARAGVGMLMDAVVVDDGDIAGLPIVAHAVVNLVSRAIEDVEGSFVDVAMLLRGAARRILLEMDVQRLTEAILRLDIMAGKMLRPAVELGFLPLTTRGIERRRLSSSVRL